MSEPKGVIIKKAPPTIFIARNKKIFVLPNKPVLGEKCLTPPPYTEDLIYSTINNSADLRKGDIRSLVLKNQLHKVTKNSRTVASFVTYDNKRIERTSDKITRLIGKKNYDNVFVALCSVINHELKVQAILALLTEDTADVAVKTEHQEEPKTFKDSACQTHEISKDIFYKKKVRPKRRVTPLIMSDSKSCTPKRVVINVNSTKDIAQTQSFPELRNLHLDEDSNCSMMSTSHLSICSDVLNNEVKKLISVTDNNIKQETNLEPEFEPKKIPKSDAEEFVAKFNPSTIVTLDGSRIDVPVKPEDQFHLATPEILKHITSEERKKLLWHQAYIDWKLCLERDEDGNMPLHLAVECNDVEVVRRHCLVLRARGYGVDVLANGVTALEMSIKSHASPACTRTLLDCGACPLRCDAEERSALHQAAAEGQPAHLKEILAAMKRRAREIVEESEEMQYPGLSEKTDEEIASHLLMHASVQYDVEGHTPLIVAATAGHPEMVAMLAAAAPQTINTGMPNSGNTALYSAVAEACMNAIERGNKAKVADNYQKTIEILIEHGADPEIENRNGSKVSDLLQEFNITSLSLLVAQKVTSKLFDGVAPAGSPPNTFMILKDQEGKLRLISKKGNRAVEKESPPGQVEAKRGKTWAVPTQPSAGNRGVGLMCQVEVQGGKKVTQSLAARKQVLMPKANSFTVGGAKKGAVGFVSKDYLMKTPQQLIRGKGKRDSPPKANANCIIIKNEILNELLPCEPKAGVVDQAGRVGVKSEVANLAEHNAKLLEGPVSKSPKRSASPGNASMPELAKVEKCAKRKSRVVSADKDRGDSKKLKYPEG